MTGLQARKIYVLCAFVYIVMKPISVTADITSPAKSINLDEVIKLIISKYPTVKIARIEVEQAKQEFARIESQLGWVLSARTGISRDVAAFDIPSEKFEASLNLAKTIKSGSSVELSGSYSYENSDISVIPAVVNPSERTRLDVNYRIPLSKGDNNPNYLQGLLLAKAGFDLSIADKISRIDALINQTAALFYDGATTQARIRDANESIKRALRLLKYVKKNKALGLVEKKDLLDVQSLYLSKVAERDNLLVIWSRQRSELNRLMGRNSNSEFNPEIIFSSRSFDKDKLLKRMYTKSPELHLQLAQLKQAESQIALANDAKKDQLDLVLSVGARNTSGDTASGSVSRDEWAGGARIEYNFSFDQRGFDADLYKQILQKQAVEEDILRIRTEINYSLDSLLEQIEKSETSIKSIKKRLSVEREKVSEAFDRYKIGRSNTNELIDNENALFASSLLYKTRKIELSRMHSELDLMLGVLWDSKVIVNRTTVSE